jgi:hypothetical protein
MTYEVWTPAGVEAGEAEDIGLTDCGEWRYSLNNAQTFEDITENPDDYRRPVEPGDLVAAIKFARDHGCVEWSGESVRSVDPVHDRAFFEDGEHTFFAVHFHGFTPSTLGRIRRAIIGR